MEPCKPSNPEPKSPSSRFLCQITARLPAPHPSPQCCSPLHKGECAPGWMFIVYMSPIHLGRSHPVITGPGRRHLLLGSSDLSPMWSLSHVPPPLSMFYLPHVVCQFEVGSFSFLSVQKSPLTVSCIRINWNRSWWRHNGLDIMGY